MFRFFTYSILFLLVTSLKGQDITFEAKVNKTEVSVNERFVIQFILTYGQEQIKVDKPLNLPNFGGLHQLGESQINSVKILNHVAINQSGVEVILVADQEGEYTIPSTQIIINGKKLKTEPITITVKKGLKNDALPGQRLQGAFIVAEISNENPFVNQEVVLVVKAFVRDYPLLHRMRDFKEPDFKDLIVKYVSEKPDNNEKQVLINGTTFISKEIARYVIFPQKANDIQISPFSIDVFISSYLGMESITLTSNSLDLKTRNLPNGAPKNFSGAIGDFTMNTAISKEKLNANESVQLEIEIVGSGNLNTLKMPNVKTDEHLETFSPKIREAYEVRPTGMKGKLVKSQILVPQYGGDYIISPIEFSFFDPKEEEYIQLKSDAFTLQVQGEKPPSPKDSLIAKTNETAPKATEETQTKEEISEVIPEKIKEVRSQVVNSVSKFNKWIWAGLIVLFIPALLFYLFKNKRQKTVPNLLSEKEKGKLFKKEINQKINELRKLSSQEDLNGFLSLQEDILTKIGMFYSSIALSNFTEELVERKLNPIWGDYSLEWKELLLKCKQSKYALIDSELKLDEQWNKTKKLWNSVSKLH